MATCKLYFVGLLQVTFVSRDALNDKDLVIRILVILFFQHVQIVSAKLILNQK